MPPRRLSVPNELLPIAGTVLFVVLVEVVQRHVHWHGPPGTFLGLVLAALPALLWLGYFRLHDALEPEPIRLVLGVFVLGAMVAWPLARWSSDLLLGARPLMALDRFGPKELATAILVTGIGQELAQYLVLRASIYRSAELDEPLDALVYATACGIGFATAGNLLYLGRLAHAQYGLVAVNVAVRVLGQTSCAAVLGLALASARFSRLSPRARSLRLTIGLVGAAALNGALHLLEQSLAVDGLAATPWRLLLFWAAVAIALLVGATRLLALRNRRESIHRPAADSAKGAVG